MTKNNRKTYQRNWRRQKYQKDVNFRSKQLVVQKKYYFDNRQDRLEYARNYYRIHKDKFKYSHDVYEKNKTRILERTKSYRDKQKLLVLSHYSNGEFKCACCNEREYKFLTVDDIDGKYHKHVGKGSTFYRWLIRSKFPEGFQILCFNCNCAKGFFGECPHLEHRNKQEIKLQHYGE